MNPVDEYLSNKEAGFFDKIKPGLQSAGLQIGTGLAIAALPAAASKIYNAVTKQHHFNAMIDHNPDLAYARDENPQQFSSFYNSLHSMNPTFARDPIVAGAYMRRMLENPAAAGSVAVDAFSKSRPGNNLLTGVAGSASKSIADSFREANRPADPLAAQRQHVDALGLQAKERELNERLAPAAPLSPKEQYNQQLQNDIDDVGLQMKHQDMMVRARQMGVL